MVGVAPPQKPKPRHIRILRQGLLAPGPMPLLRGVIRRFVLLTLLALSVSFARSQDVVLTAKGEGVYDEKTKEQVFSNSARMSDGTVLLLADEIRYNVVTQVITATGHVAFTRTNIRLLADKFVFDRLKQSFTATQVRFGSHPYYAEAESADGSDKEITFYKALVSYGEPGPWQPTAKADKVIYTPGQRLRTENAQAGIGHLQPLPFPRFQQDLKQPLLSFAQFNGGFRSSLGAFAEASLRLPATPRLRLGADLGIYTARGFMIGPAVNYGSGDDDASLRGSFRSGYINDHGDKKADVLGNPVPEDRAYAEWQHEQKLTENLSLTAQINWWKDSEILRDFRPRAFFPVQDPDSFVETVYAGQNYFLSAFARGQVNRFNRMQERLPEIRFDLLPFVIGNGFYQRFNASIVYLREDGPLDASSSGNFTYRADSLGDLYGISRPADLNNYNDSLYKTYQYAPPIDSRIEYGRFDAYYSLARPFVREDWLTVTPVAGARVTRYEGVKISEVSASSPLSYSAPETVNRTFGEVGFDAELHSSATFDYKNEQWKINGLRHLFTPRLSYRYTSGSDVSRRKIPPIDRRTFSTYLQPLGLGDQRNIDDIHAINTLRLGFDNTLQTRDDKYGSRDLLTFNIANDFRFKPTPFERNTSEIHTELAAHPTRWLSVNVYENFAPQNFTLHEFNTGITLHDADAWSARFSNNYLRNQIHDYQFDGRFRINETYEALTRLHYDVRRHRFNEQAYGITQNLGNTWLISYIMTLYSGPRRESHFGFNVQIAARGF
jgi:LPS-assembly protein